MEHDDGFSTQQSNEGTSQPNFTTENQIIFGDLHEEEEEIVLNHATTLTEPFSPPMIRKVVKVPKSKFRNVRTPEKTFQTGLEFSSTVKTEGDENDSINDNNENDNDEENEIINNDNESDASKINDTKAKLKKKAKKKRKFKRTKVPSEEELDQALALMIKKKILPDAEIKSDVINYARNLSSEKMLLEQYDEAKKIDLAIDIMFTSIQQDINYSEYSRQYNDLRRRIETAKQRKQDVINRYDYMIEEENNSFQEKMDDLKEKHLQEIDAFEEYWSRPEIAQRFNKPSPSLSQLRRQQKSMALVHDYDNAKAVKKEADVKENQEKSEALKRIEMTIKSEYKQLMEKQNKEMICLQDNHDKNIANLQLNKDKEVSVAHNAELKLLKEFQAKFESSKTSGKPKLMVPIVKQRSPASAKQHSLASLSYISNNSTTGVISNRTRAQLYNYRVCPENGTLQIKPVDVGKTVRALTPITRQRS